MTQPGYPPPYGYPPPPMPPGPPRRSALRRLWPLWLVLGLIFAGMASCAIIVGAAVGKGAHDASNALATAAASPGAGGLFQHTEDVKINTCEVDPTTGYLTTTITITNSSSKTSNYTVQVAFQSPDKTVRFGDGYAAVNRLAPGQQTSERVSGLVKPQSAGQQFVCDLVSVQRTAAP